MNFKERLKPDTKMKVLESAIPYVVIQPMALIKIHHYVDICADEVGWLGTATRKGREITIEDMYLFDQEVHSTTTEITPEGLSDFAIQLLEQPEGMDIWNKMKVWGHSHVRMAVSPSGQDDKQMETFQEGGHDWFIRIIANKTGDLKVDLYDYEKGVIYLDVPWEQELSVQEMKIEEEIAMLYKKIDLLRESYVTYFKEPIEAEMKEKVRKKSWYTQSSKVSQHTVGFAKNEKKNEKEEKEKEPTNENDMDFDYFDDEEDVRKAFDFKELIEFSECNNINEVEALAYQMGWYNVFTDEDLQLIARTAIKTRARSGLNYEQDEWNSWWGQ